MMKKIDENTKTVFDTLIEELKEENEVLTRYELSEYLIENDVKGIEGDSIKTEQLLYDLYHQVTDEFKKDLEELFVTNLSTQKLIRSNKIQEKDSSLINLSKSVGENEKALTVYGKSHLKDLENYETSLETIKSSIETYKGKSGGIVNFISGAGKINKVKDRAQNIVQTHQDIINFYEYSKSILMDYVDDYTAIRNCLFDIYKNYLTFLKDVFGNKIQSIDPELFDFSKLQWIDTLSLMNQIESESEFIKNKSDVYQSYINDKLMKSQGKVLKKNANKLLNVNFDKNFKTNAAAIGVEALIETGFNLLDNHAEAAERAKELEIKLQDLIDSFNLDYTNIVNDEMRFIKLYDTVKDIFIPVTNTVLEHLSGDFSTKLNSEISKLYQSDNIKSLHLQRDELVKNQKNLRREVADYERNANYLTNRIYKNKQFEGMTIEKIEKKLKGGKPTHCMVTISCFILGLVTFFLGYNIPGIAFVGIGIINIIINKVKKSNWIKKDYYTIWDDVQKILSYNESITKKEVVCDEIDFKIEGLNSNVSEVVKNSIKETSLTQKNFIDFITIVKSMKNILQVSIDETLHNPELLKKSIDTPIEKIPEDQLEDLKDLFKENFFTKESKVSLDDDRKEELANKIANIFQMQYAINQKKDNNQENVQEYKLKIDKEKRDLLDYLKKNENKKVVIGNLIQQIRKDYKENAADVILTLSNILSESDDVDMKDIKDNITSFLNGKTDKIML